MNGLIAADDATGVSAATEASSTAADDYDLSMRLRHSADNSANIKSGLRVASWHRTPRNGSMQTT